MKKEQFDITAIQLSKATIRNIRQNLFWAFIYKIIDIPVAAGLLFLPFALKLNQNVDDEVFKTAIEGAGYQLAEIA